jgi:hypothetical protein
MSLYALQKLIREINRNPAVRERFMADADTVAAEAGLSAEEAHALVQRDYNRLYTLGVHGLLLRPFSLIHGVAEPDYLDAIRKDHR